MKKRPPDWVEKYRCTDRRVWGVRASTKEFGNAGMFEIPYASYTFRVVISDGLGWDHVSVSLPNRCPNWPEMCYFKSIFFEPHECVIQYHPAESEYVNRHPNCLHLWRPQKKNLPIPDKGMVG